MRPLLQGSLRELGEIAEGPGSKTNYASAPGRRITIRLICAVVRCMLGREDNGTGRAMSRFISLEPAQQLAHRGDDLGLLHFGLLEADAQSERERLVLELEG